MRYFLLGLGIGGIIFLIHLFIKIYKLPEEEKGEKFGSAVIITTTLIFGVSLFFIISSFLFK